MDKVEIAVKTTKSGAEIWSGVCAQLKIEIGEPTFDLWLKPSRFVGLENNELIVELPNRFFLDWIKANLHSRIEEIISRLGHAGVTVRYAVAQNLESILKRPEGEIDPHPAPVDESTFSAGGVQPDATGVKYTFESFVVGPSNRFGHATALAVAEKPGQTFNPYLIYGGVGLGKTHLLRAIGHRVRMRNPNSRILYCTSEHFANEMIDAIRENRMPQFHQKYRSLDMLLIDDVQFISRGEQIQEVFHHTFNALHSAHKQIVLSADEPPGKMEGLQERLRSRFEWGMLAEIEKPDLETRIAILRKKAETEKIFVPDDVVLFIAEQIRTNIRALESALLQIIAHASIIGSEISVDRAREILKDLIRREETNQPITIDRIQLVVARHYHLEPKELRGKKRTDAIAFPRQLAMYLTRVLTDFSTPEIGQAFGGRDHTTVLHALEKLKGKIQEDPFFNQQVNRILEEIKGGG